MSLNHRFVLYYFTVLVTNCRGNLSLHYLLISAESEVSIGGAVTATDHMLQLVDIPVPSKRRPKSQYGGRTVFNLITQFDLKYKETTRPYKCSKQTENCCNNLETN